MAFYDQRYTRRKNEPDLKNVWIAFAAKAVLVIFLAGMGWERLSAVENAINNVNETRFEQRLSVIEAKLDLLLSRKIKTSY